MSYMNFSEYSNMDPTEYALQTNMPQSTLQSQQQTNSTSQQQQQQQQQPQLQAQNISQSQQKSTNAKNNNSDGMLTAFKNFLNVKTGTVLVFAICICIGGAFKDLVQNIITNVVQPLIVKLLLFTNIYNFSAVSDIISEKDSVLKITSAISQLISFIILLITVYFIYVLVNKV
jgi:large-conductance mechanosensitive channel